MISYDHCDPKRSGFTLKNNSLNIRFIVSDKYEIKVSVSDIAVS